MTDWILDLDALARRDESAVIVTVAGIRGSAPRETGAKMIVTATETIGSIGGGQLEYQGTARAVEMLGSSGRSADIRRYSLGANCGQCCGGVVELLFEYLPGSRATWLKQVAVCRRDRAAAVIATHMREPDRKLIVSAESPGKDFSARHVALELLDNDAAASVEDDWLLEPVRQTCFQLAIFGAGHVGAATVDLLSGIDCEVRWIDGRRNIFPRQLPASVSAIESPDPAREVAAMSPGGYYLVMTHSHPLDFDICARVLQRDDAAYCGVIGSASKRRRFERLLRKQGLSARAIGKLVCPIGVPGIASKKPAEIAIGVVAALLQARDSMVADRSRRPYLEVSG